MKYSVIKTYFSNKKNWFLVLISFFVMALNVILSTATSVSAMKLSSFVDMFPNSLSIRHTVLYKNLNTVLDENYDSLNHFEVFKFSTYSNKTNIKIKKSESVFPVTIFGIDESFLDLALYYDVDKDMGFDAVQFNGYRLTNEDLKYCAAICYVNENGSNLINKEIELCGESFYVNGLVSSKVSKSKELKFYIPITTFNETVMKKVENVDSITVDIYSDQYAPEKQQQNLLTKADVVNKFNAKLDEKNQGPMFFTFLLVLSLFSISILVSFVIKNRHNEIGIKLAVGARKTDLAAEITTEMTIVSTFGVLCGALFGAYISLLIGFVQTIKNNAFMFYLNVPLMVFEISVFIIGVIICSLICCLFGVNNNIESILKEER